MYFIFIKQIEHTKVLFEKWILLQFNNFKDTVKNEKQNYIMLKN